MIKFIVFKMKETTPKAVLEKPSTTIIKNTT
jgi:hypothetical protein